MKALIVAHSLANWAVVLILIAVVFGVVIYFLEKNSAIDEQNDKYKYDDGQQKTKINALNDENAKLINDAKVLSQNAAKLREDNSNLKQLNDEQSILVVEGAAAIEKLKIARTFDVNASLTGIKGIGAKTSAVLKDEGIKNIFDLEAMSDEHIHEALTKAGVPERLRDVPRIREDLNRLIESIESKFEA